MRSRAVRAAAGARRRALLRPAAQAAHRALLVIVLAGLALRCTIGDALPLLAALYYATPWLVLGGLSLGGAGLTLVTGRRRERWTAAGLAAVCLSFGISQNIGRAAPAAAPGPDAIRLTTWNVLYGARGWQRIAADIRAESADIVALVEAGGYTATHWRSFIGALPEYHCVFPRAGVALLSRWPVRAVRSEPLVTGGWYRVFEIAPAADAPSERPDGDGIDSPAQPTTRPAPRTFRIAVLDLPSNPLVSRRARLHELAARLAPHADDRLVLCGDFNTPADAASFAPLRRTLRSAWETAGRGWRSTWPAPLPVLDVDQVWVGPGWRVHDCTTRVSGASDHALVTVTMDVE